MPRVTRRAWGASSNTRWMFPVWSASSWVNQTHRRAAGSTIDVSASTNWSASIPNPVSTSTGSWASST